jgi:oligopeptide/dipeptide ABC transporter ATP-binding protein
LSKVELLSVKGLCTYIETPRGLVRCVDGVDLTIDKGETLGLVGESGCGKTMTARSIMGMVEAFPGVVDGEMWFSANDLSSKVELSAPLKKSVCLKRNQAGQAYSIRKNMDVWSKCTGDIYKNLRGRRIAMIFQDPQTSLNPYWTVGEQLGEAVRIGFERIDKGNSSLDKGQSLDGGLSVKSDDDDGEVEEEIRKWLEKVHIDSPARVVDYYPHELSGGMCQRIMIAIALASKPELIIADEPTTGLDVTIQAHLVDLFLELKEQTNATVLLISHDMGLIGRLADRIAVMYCGRVIEVGPKNEILKSGQKNVNGVSSPDKMQESQREKSNTDSRHPYTIALLRTLPGVDGVKYGMKLPVIEDEVPDPLSAPPGCSFHPRCQLFKERKVDALLNCNREVPDITVINSAHLVSCWARNKNAHLVPDKL